MIINTILICFLSTKSVKVLISCTLLILLINIFLAKRYVTNTFTANISKQDVTPKNLFKA